MYRFLYVKISFFKFFRFINTYIHNTFFQPLQQYSGKFSPYYDIVLCNDILAKNSKRN